MTVPDPAVLVPLLLSALVLAGLCLARAIQLGSRATRLSATLARMRETAARQSSRLEDYDSLRDDLSHERERSAALARREAELLTRLEERDRHLADLRHRLEHEFRGLSQELVREAGEALLRQASERFDQHHLAARADAEAYAQSVSELLAPVRDTLSRYEAGLREMRDLNRRAQGELSGQIESLARSTGAVQAEARALASALKAGPGTRGAWGETSLRTIVEMAGLSAHCDFTKQHTVSGTAETPGRRPDLVVTLPGQRRIAVDAKASLTHWLDAAEAETDAARQAALKAHARSLWQHAQSLAAKDYAAAFKTDSTLDFVVMFVPGDAHYAAALSVRPTLFEDSFQRGVLIATPATLIAILKSVARSWREHQTNDNAREVAALASDLYAALRTAMGHVEALGRAMSRSVAEYNRLVGSLEGRTLPRARRFRDLEMPGTEAEIASLVPLDTPPRQPTESADYRPVTLTISTDDPLRAGR